jgi:hypothetical protein
MARITRSGVIVRLRSVGGGTGFTVNKAVCLDNPKIAVIVTVRGAVTIEVVNVNVWELCPAGMI